MPKIEPGLDFTEVINKYLAKCEVVLMIIGPDWIGKDAKGNPRIVKDDDWVRIEISTALKRNVRIIPILVDGAQLPDISELPDDLKYITRLQTHELSNKRWDYDTKKLVSHLNNIGIVPEIITKNTNPRKSGESSGLFKVFIGVLIGIFSVIFLGIIVYNVFINAFPEVEEPTDPIALIDNTNISGIWKETSNDYPATFEIMQSNKSVTMSIYDMNGNMIGEGKGTVEGNNVRFHIQNFYNTTKQIIVTTLSEDKNKLNGTITITNDGINQPYIYELTKCNTCTSMH